MARTSRYSQEVRERAVRMVFEHGSEYDSEWEAICSIAEKTPGRGEVDGEQSRVRPDCR
jgi:hypothetical protein